MAARCDDPTCSCRSPELERFTNQVLRRDAARTDYLVIPLIGGVLANCLLADEMIMGPEHDIPPELLDLARSVRDLAAAARDGKSWEDETHAYGIIATLVFCNWPGVIAWGSVSWCRVRLGTGWMPRASQDIAAAVRALTTSPAPSWTESVIVAAITASVAGSSGNKDFHLLGKVGRPLRVALADRMRRANLISWPAALRAAIDDWTVPTLQQLLRSQAEAGDAAMLHVSDLEDAGRAEVEAESSGAAPQPASAPPPPTQPRDTGETQAAERLIEDAIAEITHFRTQRDRVQQERDRFADRDARHRSHIESLDRELQSARSALTRLETQLATVRQERDTFAERIAAYEAVAEGAPSSPPATAFAGRRVLVFTGAENADARAAFAQGFLDLGAAQVDCYWSDRSRGPDAFPADAIVAVDVSFMSHSTWNAIQDRARAAGAWCYWGRHGAATLSRATAAAWMAHRARA